MTGLASDDDYDDWDSYPTSWLEERRWEAENPDAQPVLTDVELRAFSRTPYGGQPPPTATRRRPRVVRVGAVHRGRSRAPRRGPARTRSTTRTAVTTSTRPSAAAGDEPPPSRADLDGAVRPPGSFFRRVTRFRRPWPGPRSTLQEEAHG